jgi:hypothetical protein
VVPGERDRLTSANAMAIVTQYDILVDCSDNVPTRQVRCNPYNHMLRCGKMSHDDVCGKLSHDDLFSSVQLNFQGEVQWIEPCHSWILTAVFD